jgi:aryl-alcohol dehydrogenase-like predicted oxidoreductase
VEKRTLGKSGIELPPLMFGGNVLGWTADEASSFTLLDQIVEAGFNAIDTADVYSAWAPGHMGGESETVIGNWLHQRGGRDKVVIATKVGMKMGSGDEGLSKAWITQEVEASLRRLQTDYIDLYQAHRDDATVPLEETLRAFEDLVRSGKALYVGVSEWSAEQISEAVRLAAERGFDRIISNQPQYSMLWRPIEAEIVPTSRKAGISQIVWSPIAQGVLTGKYLPGQPPPAGSRALDETGSRFISRLLRDDVLAAVQNLRPIAADVGLSLAQLAVAWVLQNDNVAAAIVGASRPEQVRENVRAAGVTLDQEIMARIDTALDGVVIHEAPAG